MEIEQLQLWARWLELQRDRTMAVLELDEEEAAQVRRRRRQRRREVWVKQWLTQRPLYGQYEQLLQELNREDPKGYKNFLRVHADLFGELLHRVLPGLRNRSTPIGKSALLTLKGKGAEHEPERVEAREGLLLTESRLSILTHPAPLVRVEVGDDIKDRARHQKACNDRFV
ncbi:hypothetical protein DPMN_096491 [Dreissena polymorpha]|uniref:Uncharacterized protein n=1 Tax=Dreissena polymorpha TaxID=45954 RepID=A0A9D4L9V1_DREPO|nr:hypothetical protein DPMN_096491 [Dreissena polymorpha]